jgi:hypothetical protein
MTYESSLFDGGDDVNEYIIPSRVFINDPFVFTEFIGCKVDNGPVSYRFVLPLTVDGPPP